MLDANDVPTAAAKCAAVELSRPYYRNLIHETLRDQMIEGGERDMRVRGITRGRRCSRKVSVAFADEENIEILREVLVAGRRPAEAHVGRVTGQQDVADLVLLQEVAQRRVAFGVVRSPRRRGRQSMSFVTGIGRSQNPALLYRGPASRPGNWRK